jgi:hypothetical protein
MEDPQMQHIFKVLSAKDERDFIGNEEAKDFDRQVFSEFVSKMEIYRFFDLKNGSLYFFVFKKLNFYSI